MHREAARSHYGENRQVTNRLGDALSPYLRQHADNPVDWWPWSEAAFAAARERDVPILLSVGYAACHWCHVMAHESFEDPGTADLMNARFVSIKVDREERPDIDAVYMEATQALTGQGGWPMTVFLDHAGRAFVAGTYFPPVAHGGMPSFTDVLRAVDRVWRLDRGRIAGVAGQLHAALEDRRALEERAAPGESSAPSGVPARTATLDDVVAAVDSLAADFDAARGGFGGAPKFPPSMVLEFLLRADALLRASGRGDDRALAMACGHDAGNGPRRDVRPAGRRVRAVQRGRRLGRAALREDALRQRTAPARIPALVARDGRSVRSPDRGRDRRVHAGRPADARRAASPRPWTPTATGGREPATRGRPASW